MVEGVGVGVWRLGVWVGRGSAVGLRLHCGRWLSVSSLQLIDRIVQPLEALGVLRRFRELMAAPLESSRGTRATGGVEGSLSAARLCHTEKNQESDGFYWGCRSTLGFVKM